MSACKLAAVARGYSDLDLVQMVQQVAVSEADNVAVTVVYRREVACPFRAHFVVKPADVRISGSILRLVASCCIII